MRRSSSILAAALSAATLAAPAASAQQFKTQKFNIGGEGAFDYLSVDPTGRVFVSRSTHIMVVDGSSGKVLGDIPNTPRVHGAAFAPKWNHGFTTNGGDSTSTMFDLKTLAVLKKIPAGINGLDGIMYDASTDRILTIDHSKPGTAVVIDPSAGTVVTTITLTGDAPEGGVGDGKGHIFINLEDKHAIDVVDTKTWKVVNTWSIAPCEGPTGIAYDAKTNRIFSGCDDNSVVTDASTGKIVAHIPNGGSVDAIGWDASQKLLYIPSGDGNVTVARQDSPDAYTVVATVPTMRGARTIAIDENKHVAYVFTPEYGPPPAGATPPAGGRGRGPRGPIIGAWLIVITH
jgi:DNA-binding beta-propeller fold protein YncE